MPLQLGPLACEFTPWDRSPLLCEHCGFLAEAPIHSPARRAAVAIRFRWPPICAGLATTGPDVLCTECGEPASCWGAAPIYAPPEARCNDCCAHVQDSNGGCAPLAADGSLLDWPTALEAA